MSDLQYNAKRAQFAQEIADLQDILQTASDAMLDGQVKKAKEILKNSIFQLRKIIYVEIKG